MQENREIAKRQAELYTQAPVAQVCHCNEVLDDDDDDNDDDDDGEFDDEEDGNEVELRW